MKHGFEKRKSDAKRVASSSTKKRLWTRLGGRLLLATSNVLIRLVDSIERTFRLPPEAAENALKRFTAQTGIKPVPIRSTNMAAQPERRKATRAVRRA